MEFEVWYFFVGVAVLLNIIVSILLANRDDLEIFQKSAQIFIVWLIPFFAAIGLWLFNRDSDISHKKTQQNGNFAKDDQAYTDNKLSD